MFQEMEVAQQRSWVAAIANRFQSNQELETYAGIGTVPQMREWIGAKQSHSFTEQSIQIRNKDWESTIRVKTKDLRRDKTTQLRARIGELMDRAVTHEAKLLSDLIENGSGTTLASCYDTKALFADDHSVGSSGTIDNNVSSDISDTPTATHGTTTDPSPGDFAHAVLNGVKTLRGFKDDRGEPINDMIGSLLIMVPVGLSKAAELALAQPTIAGNEANPLLNSASRVSYQLAVNARLTWTDKFAIFRTDGRMKSLIIQEEVSPVFKALAEGSDYEFSNAEHQYSVEKAGNVGLGRFDQCALITFVA